jgi:hypothetical protein
MALNWIRLDVNLLRNRKIMTLLSLNGGERALLLFIFGLCYCGEQGTAGAIPAVALPSLRGSSRLAALLVSVGLWEEVPQGWEVHDFADYQPITMAALQRSERARTAARARWGMKGE